MGGSVRPIVINKKCWQRNSKRLKGLKNAKLKKKLYDRERRKALLTSLRLFSAAETSVISKELKLMRAFAVLDK